MKRPQGFVLLPILLGILAVLAISGGAYFYMRYEVAHSPCALHSCDHLYQHDDLFATPTLGKAPLTVTFNLNFMIGYLIWSDRSWYAFDFGDGNILTNILDFKGCTAGASSCAITHTYTTEGTFTANLYLGKINEGGVIASTTIRTNPY